MVQTEEKPSHAESVLTRFTDSLYQLREKYDNYAPAKSKDILTNPYYYRLFVQPTLYFNPIAQQMDLDWRSQYDDKHVMSLRESRDDVLKIDSSLNDFFSNVYVESPQFVVTTQTVLDNNKGIHADAEKTVEHKVELAPKVSTPKPIQVFEPIQVVGHRPNFWTFKQTYGLQMMEYYFSENWYQGGTNFNSFLVTANIQANFNNQSKVTFNNNLSMQLGVQSVKSDTIHPWHSTTDQLRMVNQLAVKAAKNWSYTATLTSTTRMTPQYGNNSRVPTADFFSQFESVLAVGMAYSLAKGTFSMNVNMAPLSYDWKFVGRKKLRTRYGVYPNHHSREYIGSSVTLNYNWRLMKELTWGARMYYFTDYKKVQWEWENTFTFTINKYLNTKLYLYPRFDDTTKDDNGNHTLQFKQWLSLGFNISF